VVSGHTEILDVGHDCGLVICTSGWSKFHEEGVFLGVRVLARGSGVVEQTQLVGNFGSDFFYVVRVYYFGRCSQI
jgi:hypothetical protein